MKAIVYSTEVCPFCVQAKKLLKLKGVDYKDLIVIKEKPASGIVPSGQILKPDLQDKILQATGEVIHTVPQIFINDEYIGGFNDLVNHFNKIRDNDLNANLKRVKVNLSR